MTYRRLPPLGRLYLWATHRLYHELAWAYDLVAWVVSLGRWDRWRRLALDHVQRQPVLEVGFGTGELLLAMAGLGWQVTGIDPSPAMQRVTARKLRRRGLHVPRVRGSAQQLPFPDDHFGAIIATFPAEYIVDPAALAELHRALQPGGRLIIAGLVVFIDLPLIHPVNRLIFGRASEGPLERYQQHSLPSLPSTIVIHPDPPFRVPVIIAEKEEPATDGTTSPEG